MLAVISNDVLNYGILVALFVIGAVGVHMSPLPPTPKWVLSALLMLGAIVLTLKLILSM